jgi:hypothetical protein
MGLRSEWQFNKPRVVKATAITAAALTVAYLLLRKRR